MRSTRPRVSWSFSLALSVATVASFTAATLSGQTPGPWKPLFNGKDLTGWTVAAGRGRSGNPSAGAPDAAAPAPAPSWKVEDGVLVGGQGGGRGSLVSSEQFKDFELELDFMLAEHEKYNSGISVRTGYQINIGRHEAGEFIGVVVHRKAPGAIGPQGNVLWLDKGDEKFPNLRKKDDWNRLQISFKGPRLQVTLNGTKICDVTDDPTDPAEARWKEAGPISLQWPPAGEGGGFAGFVKYRNIRIREI